MLVGNKVDLDEYREVKYDDAKLKAENNGLLYIETSAKNGTNID